MILIAEDDANARLLFTRILSRTGHDVLEGQDGEEALRLFETHLFDLVITDLVMPKINGFDLITRIHRKKPSLPIILVSGYLSEDGAKNILAGAVEFIPKPINRNRLIATVNRLAPAKHA